MLKRLRPRDDAGLGVVEIMVSMTLIAIILMAVAPLLITAMRTSARNATMAHATQIVNQRVESARAAAGSCASFAAHAATPQPTVVHDGRGVELHVAQSPDPSTPLVCDAAHPTQRVSVTVTFASTGDVAATANTVIAVPGFR